MSAPTIDPSKWEGVRRLHFSGALQGEWIPELLAMWCLTNLANEILAYVILPNLPDPAPEMGTITLPWDMIEGLAQGFSHHMDPRPVVVRACREALEAR